MNNPKSSILIIYTGGTIGTQAINYGTGLFA